MTLTRKNVEFAKRVFADRLGDPYVYGGYYDAFHLEVGADCSGSAGIFIGAALLGADHMSWTRQFTTEDFPGGFAGFRQVSQSDLLSGNYPIKVCIHHGGGGPNSHMQIQIDGVVMESNGDHGTCTTGRGAMSPADNYWNDWWVLDGPIIEDGTPRTEIPMTDTLFADVSEFQAPVDDSYPYQVLSIRLCDGTYVDHNFAHNYAWMRAALDSGKLTFGIVYTYVRPGTWQSNLDTVTSTINANGGLHPKVVLMLDVESGGNPGGDQSDPINRLYWGLSDWGAAGRIIGYGNVSDLDALWPTKPEGIPLIVAGYGSNPAYPGKVAHQYTDGQGYGGGLPEGCAPFGNCDMNSADGLDPDAFAAACGIKPTSPGGVVTQPDSTQATLNQILAAVQDIQTQLRGPDLKGWPQLGKNATGQNLTLIDAVAALVHKEGLA
jgi:hypothetical protein